MGLFRKKDRLKKKSRSKDWFLTGIILGGAIGSVAAASLSDKDKKRIKKTGSEVLQSDAVQMVGSGAKQTAKVGFKLFSRIWRLGKHKWDEVSK